MRIAALLILFISHAAPGQSADDLTATQILDRSLEFCGGEKRLNGIHSTDMTYLLTQPDQSIAIISEKRRTGQKYVQSVLSKTHVPQTTFYDGQKMTHVAGSAVTHFDEVENVDEVKLKTYSLIQLGYKKLGYKLSRLPDKKFRNFDCYVVDAKASNGYTTTNFFDKTNFRLIMVIYPGGNKSIMIDYILKDSVVFNSHIVNTFAGSDKLQDLSLHNVDVNTPVSDLWFTSPYTDKVVIPPSIKAGSFESTNGENTFFVRTEISQDYKDEEGKLINRRFLKWTGEDTFVLIDEMAMRNAAGSPESETLVRIISWDEDEYVCHWISGRYTDTQDYRLVGRR